MAVAKERFSALLSEVAREVTRRRSSEACCGDLTLEQFETLRAIAASAQATIGSLSGGLSVDLSTMSRNVSVMERNGYLRRARSAADGRVVLVGLTAKGRNALETLRCGERDVLGDVFERLSPDERSEVVQALEALRGCLRQDAPVAGCCRPSVPRRKSL
ncbi:MAG TPA: MarR family winged helix-turn-helix transcriptional regulator [Polyangia bacterium]|nr:MarR family winged helix-turn-helix transcriptional regulator [Polyangia bacterium]